MSINAKMTAIADEIRELSGTTAAMGLDAMASNLGEANNEVASQEDLIADIVTALEGKAIKTEIGVDEEAIIKPDVTVTIEIENRDDIYITYIQYIEMLDGKMSCRRKYFGPDYSGKTITISNIYHNCIINYGTSNNGIMPMLGTTDSANNDYFFLDPGRFFIALYASYSSIFKFYTYDDD